MLDPEIISYHLFDVFQLPVLGFSISGLVTFGEAVKKCSSDPIVLDVVAVCLLEILLKSINFVAIHFFLIWEENFIFTKLYGALLNYCTGLLPFICRVVVLRNRLSFLHASSISTCDVVNLKLKLYLKRQTYKKCKTLKCFIITKFYNKNNCTTYQSSIEMKQN